MLWLIPWQARTKLGSSRANFDDRQNANPVVQDGKRRKCMPTSILIPIETALDLAFAFSSGYANASPLGTSLPCIKYPLRQIQVTRHMEVGILTILVRFVGLEQEYR